MGVVLLRAHPRNGFYVAKWTFMCPLRGSKMGRLEAFLGQFRRCWGHEVPFLRCFAQIWRRNAIWGVPGRLLGLLRFFLLCCRSSIQGVSHIFAASRGFLCEFTWLFPGATLMCFYVSHAIYWGQCGGGGGGGARQLKPFFIVFYCCPGFSVFYCFLLLFIAFYCFLLLFIVFLLLPIVFHCFYCFL